MGQLDRTRMVGCELCMKDGGRLIVRTDKLRVVRVEDTADYPGFYRVIWNAHVAEFSDLAMTDRMHLVDVVTRVEQAMLRRLEPNKINLASLGNVVPHLHWHVVARYADDRHFPQPIWGTPQREIAPDRWASLKKKLSELDEYIHDKVEGA